MKAFADHAEIVEMQEKAANSKQNGKYFGFQFIPTETIEALLKRGGLSQRIINQLEKNLGEKAAVIAKLDYYRTFDHFKKILADNALEGEAIDEFIDRIGKNELTKTLGIAKDKPWYSDVVYRTASAQAYSAGKYNSYMDDKKIIMLEFVAVGDERTTEQCSSRNGTSLPKDHPFWSSNTPPLHYSCRSDILEYTQAYIEAFNIQEIETPATAEPLEGFGGTEEYKSGNWLYPTKKMREDLGVYE